MDFTMEVTSVDRHFERDANWLELGSMSDSSLVYVLGFYTREVILGEDFQGNPTVLPPSVISLSFSIKSFSSHDVTLYNAEPTGQKALNTR